MGILRVLVHLISAAFLAGCVQHIPVYETQNYIPTTTDQPDPALAANLNSETKKPKPPAPKPNAVSATSHKDTKKLTTQTFGSPEKLEKERVEDERKERQLKQVIEGICRGC